jgi:hypothetical protein
MTGRAFTNTDFEWVRSYVDRVRAALRPRLDTHASRFVDGDRLLQRLLGARDSVLAHGWSHFGSIDEAHNELCVAVGILESDSGVTDLRYEPSLPGTELTIDFVASHVDQAPSYVDVKTIAPRSVDRWEQYAKAQVEEWLPEQATVTLREEWLGGQLWHSMVAARSRMLEYTVELEGKVTAANLAVRSSAIIMMFCSNGFHWHQDELEDFSEFYVTGRHRADDHFAKMELLHLEGRPLPAARAVRQFGYVERSSGAVLPHRMTWRVVAPRIPF